MNTKTIIVILAVVCIGLGIAVVAIKLSNDQQHDKDVSSIVDFSNQVVSADQHIDSLNQVNLSLTNDLSVSQQLATDLSNNLAATSAALASAKSALASAQDQVLSLTNQVTTLDAQISDLQAQNNVLDQRAAELTNTIARLSTEIAQTEEKLAIAETNNAFFQTELQRQLAEKAELERKFNDLDEVRAQVRRLKDERFIARRNELDRYSNGMKKGGALLIQRAPLNVPKTQPAANYDLDVEVGSDGSVKVIPPLGATNAPAH